MPIAAYRDDLSRLIRDDQAQLVEVLPRAEDDWAHLLFGMLCS